jgi:hypothetical protein
MGSKYVGYKLNGKRHGQGTFHYQDGGKYEGEWREDKMNGKGTLYYQSNLKAYEGQWLNDEFHGHGTLFNESPADLRAPFDFSNFDKVDDYWVSYEGTDRHIQDSSSRTPRTARAHSNFRTGRSSGGSSGRTWWREKAASSTSARESYAACGTRTSWCEQRTEEHDGWSTILSVNCFHITIDHNYLLNANAKPA